MFTLSTVSWIIFIITGLVLIIYGIRNRHHIGYPCTIEKRFTLGLIGWAILGTGLLMVNIIVNPPPC